MAPLAVVLESQEYLTPDEFRAWLRAMSKLPSGDLVAPDASYVAGERFPPRDVPPTPRRLRIVPDLIVEVLSSSSESRDRGEKKGIYERNGVREYWTVDWRRRQVVLFSLGTGGRYDTGTTFGEDATLVSNVLPGLQLPVAAVLGD